MTKVTQKQKKFRCLRRGSVAPAVILATTINCILLIGYDYVSHGLFGCKHGLIEFIRGVKT